jgi:glycosyltransferase involved in cell wall biosynthesis
MIVKNEAHIVQEVLDSVAPHISSWVVVDTGSDDGTQDLIRKHMAALGIPGELHERPWRNFGHNRTEALALAQGHGDYIWVIDADDILLGTLKFTRLDADIYTMRMGDPSCIYWRPQLFRDGVLVRWVGVVHEIPQWDDSYVVGRVEGEYRIESRRLGARSQDPQKYARDAELLLAEVERNPDDARSVFYLAQSYFDLGDLVNARKWYARRAEMGGWDEEVYYSKYRLAESMERLDEPWPDVQDAYLKAWDFRPTRAEPLHAIARHLRIAGHPRLGYFFAERAAQIPIPEQDILIVRADVYTWQIRDEQAICAFYIGKQAEAFMLNRRLLASADVPEDDRQRIAGNRDFSVPAMIEEASTYPDALVDSLIAGPRDGEVTVSLIAGPDPAATEHTLNSFLHCCTDVTQVRRFLVVDAGLTAPDRAKLAERYGFIEIIDPGHHDGPGSQLAHLRNQIHTRLWLHLGQGWQFFAPEDLITRLTAVLDTEPDVVQVGINLADATKLTGSCATEQQVRRAPDAGRYVLTDAVASGPAMFHTTRLDHAGGIDDTHPISTLQHRATAAGLSFTTLDQVLCITAD